ncbi:MAG: DNA topoisomerase IV subunit A [Myxococcales bacterium]|nr:DNA topoisomerase IV subunit A [Polyangiaceae bacterium]MDW8249918.1 DNA topoisomerase IV subunit A [Myxococcales bacterium]
MSSSVTYLSQEARVRYANYALSVVTSRALPDVRDGLKPVQRRILFTMKHDLGLTPDAKYRKSAKIVGDVMGNYHPHGDMAIYDAMVRMAQPWVMRATLVDGQGNFGSPDDDAAAAYRYTEAKLTPIALELLEELGKQTVSWRPSYDGTRKEPTVLPARFPNLLVNGAQGIAVGMATSIPPHNLGEVIDACVAQIDAGRENPLPTKTLLKYIKGPDFPTGATLQATREDLLAVYEGGSGTLRLRGDYRVEERKGGSIDLILTSVPYGVARKDVVEKVADIIVHKKLPAMVDVRDESTTDVRIVIELKKGSDPHLVMAYLYKHTSLQTSVAINMTCLVPASSPAVQGTGLVIDGAEAVSPVPERLGLQQMIQHFLDFRMETVRRRLIHDLDELRGRIHLLEGFDKIFNGVDEALKLIRKSQNKADARVKLVERFGLSELQANAVLEMQLFRLSHLEIQDIRKELDQRRAEARRMEALLKSEAKRWELIKGELMEIKAKYGEKRKTKVIGSTDEPEYTAEDFIAAEDTNVILSTQGWIKRVRELKDINTTRLREGDSPLAAVAGSTKHSVAFFSNFGACYVMRIHDVPPTTGHGDPVQKFFKLDDGERIIACMSFDPRVISLPSVDEKGDPQPPYGLAVTRGGLSFRFPLAAHREPSNKTGRRYARLNEGDEVVMVASVGDQDGVIAVASDGVALGVSVKEIPVLSGAGKGSALMRLSEGERIVGAQVILPRKDTVQVETEKGKILEISWSQVEGERGRTGHILVKRERFSRLIPPPPVTPSLNPN